MTDNTAQNLNPMDYYLNLDPINNPHASCDWSVGRSMKPLLDFAACTGEKLQVTNNQEASDTYNANKIRYMVRVGNHTVTWDFMHWDACCAQGFIARLHVGYAALNNSAFMSAFVESFPMFLKSQQDVHTVHFAFSEEEYEEQLRVATMLGFVDTAEPYISYKTGNMIHNMMLVLATEEDLEDGDRLREENERGDDYGYDEDEYREIW